MKPYKCPICEGRGLVPGGFYLSTSDSWTSNRTSEPCRACQGTGVVWESMIGQIATEALEPQESGDEV